MRTICNFVVLVLLGCLSSTARGDGLIYTLPKDGAWVSFNMEGKEDKTHRGNGIEHFEGYLKISSVGTETVDGEKCRWLEIEQTWDRTNDPTYEERKQIFKLLIPEKHLKRGADPGEHIVRAYKIFGKTPLKGQPKVIQEVHTSFRSLMLGGPLENIEKLVPKMVQCKLGKVNCGGVLGETEIDSDLSDAEEGLEKLPFRFEIRLHEKAPFGVVSYLFKGLEPNNDVVKSQFILDDFGTGAVSLYPEAN